MSFESSQNSQQNHSYSSDQPPSKLLQFTVAMIGMFAFLQVYSVQAILPVLMQDFDASEVQVGVTVGMTVMAIAAMSPFMGMLSDAFGRKLFVVGCLLLMAVPTAMLGLSTDIKIMYLWRFLQGLFVPGITVVTIAYIGEEFPRHIAKMMSMYVSGTVLGGFLGRFIIGYLHDWVGWQKGYLITAVFMVLASLWVARTLPASRRFVVSENFAAALTTLIAYTKNAQVVSACLLGACVLFSLVSMFTFVNLHLAQAPYHLTPVHLANIFAVYLIGMVITPLTAGLVRRFGTTHAIIIAVVTSMLGVLLSLLTPLPWVVVGLTVVCSGVFITQAATISHITANVSEGRSLASGLYYMCYYAGGSVGAWLCGIVYTCYGWLGVTTTVNIVQLLALAIVFFGMRQDNKTNIADASTAKPS